jgi:methyl-accepting chemotaxis protein
MDSFATGLIATISVLLIFVYVFRESKVRRLILVLFLVIAMANLQGMLWIYLDDSLLKVLASLFCLAIAAPIFFNTFSAFSKLDHNISEMLEKNDLDKTKLSKLNFFRDIENRLLESVQQNKNLRGQNEETVQQLGSMSKELAITIEEQSSSMTEQSSALNETASTVQELGVTANQTTDKANLVLQSAEKSMDISNRGHEAFNSSVESMFEIRSKVERIAVQILELSSHTQKIGSIINTVDDIAETTNLLALNASIEASKAGESGRGFQVVASEIRKLAEQSKRSVADIAAIISEIQNATNSTVMATEEGTKGVDIGVELINKAGSLMEESISSLEDNLNAAQQILAANKQQTIGIDQITHAISNVNVVVKQVSAGIMQTKEAVKTLTVIAEDLKKS